MALVLNRRTIPVSLKFHIKFDNNFSTTCDVNKTSRWLEKARFMTIKARMAISKGRGPTSETSKSIEADSHEVESSQSPDNRNSVRFQIKGDTLTDNKQKDSI